MELKPSLVALVAVFETEVDRRASEIDPDDEQDWFSLTLGWGLGRGLSPDEANELAVYIRYHTKLG